MKITLTESCRYCPSEFLVTFRFADILKPKTHYEIDLFFLEHRLHRLECENQMILNLCDEYDRFKKDQEGIVKLPEFLGQANTSEKRFFFNYLLKTKGA